MKFISRLPLKLLGHIVFLLFFLNAWEFASRYEWLNPTFFGRPSGIVIYIFKGLFISKDLWLDLSYTVAGTLISFFLGSTSAICVGLAFAMFPKLEKASEPYFMVLNAMPRLALAPLFLLWFGLGIWSKVAVGTSLSFFIVLASTVAGIRGVSADHVTLARALGASSYQLFFQVTLPSAVPVIASGLRLGLIFSMLGVIGSEIIAAEHGLGQVLAYLQSTFNMNGVMGVTLLLAFFGMTLTVAMAKLERIFLKWQ
jgi:NitT/TauT family transport system permease protein